MRLCSVAFLLGFTLVSAAAEPTYKGKTLPEWLKVLTSDDAVGRRDAASGLGQLGVGSPEAAEALLKALTDSDEQVRRLAVLSLGELRPEAKRVVATLADVLVKDRSASVRQQAAVLLGKYGKEAKPALAALVSRVRQQGENPDVRQQAARAIGQIGPEAREAIPALVPLLDDRDGTLLWFHAKEALLGIGPNAVGPVVAALRKPDGKINSRALDAASGFGRAAVPRLRVALMSADAGLRLAAAVALVRASAEDAEPARPILDSAARDIDYQRRQMAMRSLVLLNFMTTPSVAGLVEALKHEQPAVRVDAANSLGEHGLKGRDALPALREALKDTKPEVQFAAAIAIARIDPELGDAAVLLLSAVKDPQCGYRARQAVDKLARPALPALTEAMKNTDGQVRGEAALTILGVDRRAWKTALPALTEWITSETRETDREAPGRLRDLDPLPRTALSKALLLAFEGKGPGPKLDVSKTPFGPLFAGPELDSLCLALVEACGKDRARSARALEKVRNLGPRARAAVPGLLVLAKKAQDSGGQPDLPLIQALGAIGPEARAAIPMLLASLEGTGNRREEVVRALGKIGPDARAAVPALVKLLKDKPDARLQPILAEVLGQIGPPADEATPLLVLLLGQKNPMVQDRVLTALARIGNRGEPVRAGLKAFLEAEKARKSNLAGRAALTLLRLEPDSTLACRTLVEAVDQYGNPMAPWQEVELLFQEHAQKVTPILADALADTRLTGMQRAQAAHGLRAIGPRAKEAREALRRALTDGDRTVRVAAALALATVDPTVAEAVPPLVDSLDRPGPYYSYEDRKKGISGSRPAVPALLPRFGKLAVPHLIAALKSPREEQRKEAAIALGEIGPDAREAADELLRVLKEDSKRGSRAFAGLALSQVDPARTEAVEPLLGLLKDPLFFASMPACKALGRFGPAARDSRPTLVKLATHDQYRVGSRSHALRSLVGIGAEADAVTALSQHLRRPENYEFSTLDDFDLIQELGPKAKELTEPLRDLLGWRLPYVRIQAARALARVNPDNLNEAVESLELDLHNSWAGLRGSGAGARSHRPRSQGCRPHADEAPEGRGCASPGSGRRCAEEDDKVTG